MFPHNTALPVFGLLTLALALCRYYRRWRRISVSHVPGPTPESFLLGNLREILHGEAAEADLLWQKDYGGVVKFKAPFGEDRLMISDPKALRYIYQTSGYNFHKQPERIELSRLIGGRGILWADGDDHKRHRRVMQPAFGAREAKLLLPVFYGYADKLRKCWQESLDTTSYKSQIFDVYYWLSRSTLDAIGSAAFDYEFGTLQDANNPLTQAYLKFTTRAFGMPSPKAIFFQSISQYLPCWFRTLLSDWLPTARLKFLRYNAMVANGVAKELVDLKSQALLEGMGNKDVMSLLVKANASEAEKRRLSDEEMIAQMRTLMFAGHETTANTLSFSLLELARHPDIQTRLRAEIKEAIQRSDSGQTYLDMSELENMTYLGAVIKEVLRFHPVVHHNFRQAAKDDVLPLSRPIVTTTGEIIDELPVPQGINVTLSIAAYNRNPDLFGADAHIFNPERWLDGTVAEKTGNYVGAGVYANLLSFAGGVRSCIGWRLALLELQAYIVTLISTFEFSLTVESTRIRRESAVVMVPTVEGQREKGAWLPLRVTPCIE